MKPRKILVADDAPTIVSIMQFILESADYEVITASDGIEAINQTYRERPDLIFLDIFMPFIDGYQVCRLLKADRATAHIPIIILTGAESGGDEFWSLQTGAERFMTKDFEPEQLFQAIEQINAPEPSDIHSHESPAPLDAVEVLSRVSKLLDRELLNATLDRLQLETILHNLGEGVFAINKDREITLFNRALQTMTGISAESAVGNNCDQVFQTLLGNQREDSVFEQALIANDDIHEVEFEIERHDGKRVPISSSLALLRDHLNRIVGAVCVWRDITRRKQVERMHQELQTAYQELQSTQAQLVQSEKMASLGELVAGVAHELNNPINFIYSNIEPLRDYIADIMELLALYGEATLQETDTERVQSLKEEIELDYILEDLDSLLSAFQEGATRVKQIVTDLRTFSRLDEAEIKAVDIHEGIETTLTLLTNKYKHKITVHKDYAELPPIQCYAGQLNQVFMNLLANAEQAIQSEGDVWITTRREGDRVRITIRDNGCGIPRENLDKIFDPFFTTKDVGEGTGLGLSISYGIIEKHHGRLLVESQVGVGTTFTIELPIEGVRNEPQT